MPNLFRQFVCARARAYASFLHAFRINTLYIYGHEEFDELLVFDIRLYFVNLYSVFSCSLPFPPWNVLFARFDRNRYERNCRIWFDSAIEYGALWCCTFSVFRWLNIYSIDSHTLYMLHTARTHTHTHTIAKCNKG